MSSGECSASGRTPHRLLDRRSRRPSVQRYGSLVTSGWTTCAQQRRSGRRLSAGLGCCCFCHDPGHLRIDRRRFVRRAAGRLRPSPGPKHRTRDSTHLRHLRHLRRCALSVAPRRLRAQEASRKLRPFVCRGMHLHDLGSLLCYILGGQYHVHWSVASGTALMAIRTVA